jgi:O-antigen ligase
MSAYLIPALPGLAALGLWALLDLEKFLCVAVLATMIFPNTLVSPGGTQVALADLLLVIALCAWIVANGIGAQPGPWIRQNRMVLPLLLFVGINVGSLAWSVNPHATAVFAVQLVEIAVILPIAFGSIPTSMNAVRRGQQAFVIASAVLGVAALMAYIPKAAHGDTQGVYLWGIHKNATGSFVAAGLVLAYTMLLQQKSARGRLLYGLLMLAEIAGLVASVSRGAILGALIAVIAVSFALRRARIVSLLAVAIAATAFVGTIGLGSRGQKQDASGSYDSSVVRKYSFANAIPRIRARPILGVGAGAYFDTIPELRIAVLDPQNVFLLTWAEVGVLGFAALLYLLYSFGSLLRRVARLPPDLAGPSVAAAGVAVTFFVHVQVDETWIRGQTSLAFAMIGLMVTAERLALARRSDVPAVAGATARRSQLTTQPI